MKLQDVCELFTDGDWIESKDQSDDGIRLIQTGNIGVGKYLEKEGREKYISENTFKTLNCTEIYSGDVLISRLPEPVGRGCIIPEKQERMITAVDCTICRVNESIVDKRYFCYYLQSSTYYNQVEQSVTGTTRKRISRKNLGNVEITIPEKEKQLKIINVLDKVSAVINARKSELQKLDELIKSRFVEMFGDSEKNTNSFPVEKLGNLCNVRSSKRIYQSEQCSKGVPFLRISDLSALIDKASDTSNLYISDEKYTELFEQGLVPSVGDVLITSRGTLGKCYIIKENDRFYFQDGMISWLSNISDRITSLYLSYLFSMTGIQKQIINLQAGSTVAYLSISMLKKLDIMIPPKKMQERFAAFVAQTDKSKLLYRYWGNFLSQKEKCFCLNIICTNE